MRRNPSNKLKRAVLTSEFTSYAAVFENDVLLKSCLHTPIKKQVKYMPNEHWRTLESIPAAGVGVDE